MRSNEDDARLPKGATRLLAELGLHGRQAAYVSTPITTGRRYLDWVGQVKHPSGPELDAHREAVVAENIRAASDVVAAAKKRYPVVIDPTALDDVPGWSQKDYHNFWVEVIRRHIKTIILVDGWQYSIGSVTEFAAARAEHLQILDQKFQPLDTIDAENEIREATTAYEAAGADASKLHAILERFDRSQQQRDLTYGYETALERETTNIA